MFCRATPYEGREPYIFVSYCHADKEAIYPLIEQMSLDGYRTWYDVGNKPGVNWLLNIENHLENAKAVIVFISKHSSDSNNCNKEIVYAIKCEKKVIPVLIEDVALPKGLRMQMVDLHYLERKNFPSDKELLKKCYEADECRECRNPSGVIPLRNGEPARISDTPRQNGHGGFMDNLVQIDRRSIKKFESEPAPEHQPESKACPEAKSYPKPQPYLEPQPYLIPKTEPKPEPEPSHESDSHAAVPAVAPIIDDCDEETQLLGFAPDMEETGSDDHAPRNTRGFEIDYDQTVLISRNLAILLHPAQQKAYKLTSPKITLGRSKFSCDVIIEGNDSISKVHAFIRQTRLQCYIEDANSSNGTYINGMQIEPNKQIPLENPAIFQLNDETLILLSGSLARKFDKKESIALLINDAETAIRIMDSDTLPLNRSNKWPDGTLSDPKVHRAAHALLSRRDDGVYLIDEGPEKGNGTYLNGSRMHHKAEKRLTSGDCIRLGDTTLEFITIEIPS